jgi:NAD-dependent SIR2 family protein deacetylase
VCSIPDFRSKRTGLYNSLDCAKIGIPSPELLFDIEFFKMDPAPFYKYAVSLLPNESIQPSDSHRFIALLEHKQKLLRLYTQNVDGLERKAGITHLIECHGTMAEFQCMRCKKKTPLNDEIRETVKAGKVCICTQCETKNILNRGTLKPCVTFFGENIAASVERTVSKDVAACDCVIVVGTSLKVGGSVNELLKQLDPSVPKILINRDQVVISTSESGVISNIEFHASLLGDCDCIVRYLCSQLHWSMSELNQRHLKASQNGVYEREALLNGGINASGGTHSSSGVVIKMKRDKSSRTGASSSGSGGTVKLSTINAAVADGHIGLCHLEIAQDYIDDLVQFHSEIMVSQQDGLQSLMPSNYISKVADIVAKSIGMVETSIIPLAILLNEIDDYSMCEYTCFCEHDNKDHVNDSANSSTEILLNPQQLLRFINRNAWVCLHVDPVRSVFRIAYEGEEDKLAVTTASLPATSATENGKKRSSAKLVLIKKEARLNEDVAEVKQGTGKRKQPAPPTGSLSKSSTHESTKMSKSAKAR